MKKEDLMKLDGMTEELATKIAEQSAEELKGYIPKSRFDEVNEAKKNAESLIKERDKQLETLKSSSGNNEELQKQIKDLQEENKTAKKEYEDQIKKMQIDNAVKSALQGAGAKDITAARALLIDLDKAELDDEGNVKGLSEQITNLQKEKAFLFEEKADPQFKGATPPKNGADPKNGVVTKEQFAKMGYKERNELFLNNRELYDSLVNEQ